MAVLLARWPESSGGRALVLCEEALRFPPGGPVDFFGGSLVGHAALFVFLSSDHIMINASKKGNILFLKRKK